MKYAIQILILVVFLFVSMYLYQRQKTMQQNEDYARYRDSMSVWIGTITHDIDSIKASEVTTITNIKKIHHVYDSTHRVIYYLSDSAQFRLLTDNLHRFEYLLNTEASEDN